MSGPVVRLLEPGDANALAELFGAIDATHFGPHPLTEAEAQRLVEYRGRDVYSVLEVGGHFAAYGILRGWDAGFAIPSLGIAVRNDHHRRGYGRLMMDWLTDEARRRGAKRIRLRVHPANVAARSLYGSVGYVEVGLERGELVMVKDVSG